MATKTLQWNKEIYGVVIQKAITAFKDVCTIQVHDSTVVFTPLSEDVSIDTMIGEFFNYCTGLLKRV